MPYLSRPSAGSAAASNSLAAIISRSSGRSPFTSDVQRSPSTTISSTATARCQAVSSG
ncbi:MAG: hypothetical protein JXR83_23160 [Deltaproteobacteria bacterium]|nr:hypothetical protein [Deltaproteobacteria bacterium]